MRMARTPIYKFYHSYSSTNVTTGAWVELIASLQYPASAVEIFNGTGAIVKLSIGAAAAEDASEIPYYIIPGGSSIMLPLGFSREARISARAVDQDATTGTLVLNFFG
jgi:hypothetical protein